MHHPSQDLAKAGAWEALLLAVDSAGEKKATSVQSSPRAGLAAGTAPPRAASVPLVNTAMKRSGKAGPATAFKRLAQKPPSSCWQRVVRVPLAERSASPQPSLVTPCRSGELLGTRRPSGELLPNRAGNATLETCALAARMDALLQQRAAVWQQMEAGPAARPTGVRCAGDVCQQPSSCLGAAALQPAAVLAAYLGHVSEEDAGPLLAARRFLAQF